jgi:hypothetical protein
MSSAPDYDAPRRPVIDVGDAADDALDVGRTASQSPTFDLDEADAVERYVTAGLDAADEELTAPVIPIMTDEFRCSRCFLVQHRSQVAVHEGEIYVCRECA